MKLAKAIEIQKDMLYRRTISLNEDQKDSIKLLIEAGERCQELQSPTNFSPMRPLPGETED